jgi:outer membrane protein assembly factor BamB
MSADTIGSANTSASSSAPQPKIRKFPGWVEWILVAISVLGIAYVQTRGGAMDHAWVNILTLVFGFIALVTLLIWFCFRSSYPARARYGLLIGIALAVGSTAAAAKVEEVDGNMFPRFAWRWKPAADSQLGRIEPVVSAPGARAPKPSDLLASDPAADFPEFLGPGRENYLPGPELSTDWQSHGPREIWRRPIGAGWSAFAIVGQRAVTMEQRGDEEWVTCYDAATGEPLWGHAVTARHETTLGGVGPRSTPTIHAGKVFAFGATGILRCLDFATGKLLWQDDLLRRAGLTPAEDLQTIAWGRAASPLIVDDLVVVPPGGKPGESHSLIAYKQANGEVAWEEGDQQTSYASPMLATLGGVRQILVVNENSVAGHDPASGQQLWDFPWSGSSSGHASASQPHVLAGDRVLISKGYDGGSAVWQISQSAGKWNAELVWDSPRLLKTKFTNATVIDDHAYGLSDGILECIELGKKKSCWKKGRYGHGQLLGVGKLLLIISERGEIALVAANPDKYEELASFAALDGKTWNNPALVGHRLFIRNGEEAACYELP